MRPTACVRLGRSSATTDTAMHHLRALLDRHLGPPIAGLSCEALNHFISAARRGGVDMMHTARPFTYYRKVFYEGRSGYAVLRELRNKRIVDIGCGYTPYAEDSMFRACRNAGIEFFAVDPLLGEPVSLGCKERALALATGSSGRFNKTPSGLSRAIAAPAQQLPFAAESINEILCSFLLFVWIDDDAMLAEILEEFQRVLVPGGVVKLYPMAGLHLTSGANPKLQSAMRGFELKQSFVHGGLDWRVMPAMLTAMERR